MFHLYSSEKIIYVDYKTMPYLTRKVRGKNCYRVTSRNKKTGKRRLYSKCTTKANAQKQLRLLNAIHFNKNFVPNKRTRRTR